MVDVARGLREDLAAAIETEEAIAAAPEAVEPIETPAPKTPKESEQPETLGAERPRGPDGKFLPKEAESAPGTLAEPTPKETKKPEKPESVEPEKATKPVADPIGTATARWSAADKAMLAKLPDEGKQFLVRRQSEMEADYTKKTQAIAEFRKEYEPVDQLFAPFRQQMQQQGWTVPGLVKAWAQVEKDLMDGKGVEIVAKIIRSYKVDPAEIAKVLGTEVPERPKPNGQAIQLDPEVQRLLAAHLEPLLDPFKRQVAEVVGFTQAQREAIQRQQQMQRDQEMQSANQTVQNFIDAADKNGQLLHPHYSEVEALMVTLAQAERAAGRKPDLERIYDQAVYATPSTRERLLAANQAAQEVDQQAKARAKATAAKNAAVSVSGAPTGGPAPRTRKEPASIREALQEAAAEHEDAA